MYMCSWQARQDCGRELAYWCPFCVINYMYFFPGLGNFATFLVPHTTNTCFMAQDVDLSHYVPLSYTH